MTKQKIIFITGPTSSGKSDLAIFLAKKFNGEIINADSRQVYKFLDIGSGKFDDQNLKIKFKKNYIIINNIKHYLISIAYPKKNYSLFRWLKDAEKSLSEIFKNNKLPIFSGGTNLYLKAIKEGWVLPDVGPNYKLRKKLEKLKEQNLYQEIKKLDPERAKKLDIKNKRRLIRALEIIYKLGKVPPLKKEKKYDILIIALKIDKEKLFKKIKKRLIKRVPKIIKEIKKLRRIGLSFNRIINFGLEYKWFGMYVKLVSTSKTPSKYNEVKINLDYYISRCYMDILRFAKRQIREIKKIKEIFWVENKKEAVKIVENFLKQKS